MKISKHFTDKEFMCPCCGECIEISKDLLNRLEILRKFVNDEPIYITSGYRCKSHNLEVGGVSNSQHLLGKAADIYVKNMTIYGLYQLCLKIFPAVGMYDTFIHVDVRDGTPGEYTW